MKPRINLKHPKEDILSGIIIGLVSIPISMGYAQIAGLPAVYGLYGSFLPVLLFALLTSSSQFVVGVDAMPAVMVGGLLSELGLAAGSEEAMGLVPVVSLLCALWFLVFRLIRAGRVVKFISTPVMGGFISGIGCTIILMQVPKLFGGSAGTGELIPLLLHIAEQLPAFHSLSAALGFGTVAVIMLFKKLKPGLPMSVILMLVGILLTAIFHLDAYGVKTLPSAQSGLPGLILPDLTLIIPHFRRLLTISLTISLVIMAQSLLAASSYAARNHEQLDQNRELVSYAVMNLTGCLVGCCPINGSVSRTGMAEGLGTKSQLTGITASITILLILLFGTGLLCYMPVPVLTGIVTTALIGIVDHKLAARLYRIDRMEFLIFLAAFFGVLLLGTIYGVVIGVALSFFDVLRQAVVPPRSYLGVLPGHQEFYNLDRVGNARPINGTVIYRFSGSLFFANFETFRSDLDAAVTPETTTVIIDGRGISDIDITAADNLKLLYNDYCQRGVRFYLTEHEGRVNDSLRRYGAEALIEAGAVRRTIALALAAEGLEQPYPTAALPVDSDPEGADVSGQVADAEDSRQLAEFEWLFGADMDRKLKEAAFEVADSLTASPYTADGDILDEAERHSRWKHLAISDEDELLTHLSLRLEELADAGRIDSQRLKTAEALIAHRMKQLEDKLQQVSPEALEHIARHRETLLSHLHSSDPVLYRHYMAHLKHSGRELHLGKSVEETVRKLHAERLSVNHPEAPKDAKDTEDTDQP